MDVLGRLESQVAALLAELRRLKEGYAYLDAQIFALQEEKTALVAENRRLTLDLEKEGQLRAEARRRIDALLRKVEEHDSIE